MISRTTFALAFFLVVLTSCCPGWCGSSPVAADDSSCNLLEGESFTQAGVIADGGQYSTGPGYENVTVTSISVSLFPKGVDRSPGAIEIESFPTTSVLMLDWPPGRGTFTLVQLNATVSDAVTEVPIDGTLVVTELASVCSDETCGSLAATLTLPPVSGGGGPFVSGTADLSVSYNGKPNDCSFSPAGGG